MDVVSRKRRTPCGHDRDMFYRSISEGLMTRRDRRRGGPPRLLPGVPSRRTAALADRGDGRRMGP
jgi:hypothetical protein